MLARLGVLVVVVVVAALVGCGSDRVCRSDQYVYDDTTCGLVDAGPPSCHDAGDGRTYTRCATDDECCDPQRPYGSLLGLYREGDWNCNDSTWVCRAKATNDCPTR